MKRVLLTVLIVTIILVAACASPPAETITVTPPTITITQTVLVSEPPKIEDGWIRLNIKDIGSFEYPTDFLELQSGDYELAVEVFAQILELPITDFTLQQVGLNEFLPSAFDEYRRVIFLTFYLNPGDETFRAKEEYIMSQEELDELEQQLKDDLVQGFEMFKTVGSEMKLVESVSLEIKEVNGMFPLVHTYKRQLNDNPVVLVQVYMFPNYDREHYLSFSYRVIDEEESRDIYDKILDSFRLQ